MDDLVKRLRSLSDCDARSGEPLGRAMREAAYRIDALERQVKAADALFDKVSGKYVDYTLVEALDAYRAARESDT